MLDKLLDKLAFLQEWFPEGWDLTFLDPLIDMIGLSGNREAGQIVVLAAFFATLLCLWYLAQLPFRLAKRRAAKREAQTTKAEAAIEEPPHAVEPPRPVDEIETDLERALEKMGVPGEDTLPEIHISDAEIEAELEAGALETEAAAEPEAEAEPEAPAPAPIAEEPLTKEGLFARLRRGLSKTKDGFLGRIDRLVSGRKIDDDLFEELEEVLIQADIGVKTTYKLLQALQEKADSGELTDGEALKKSLKEQIRTILAARSAPLEISSAKPFVLLVCGVNGVGKTTTIGKLAKRFTDEKRSTMLVAADTFRAAAIEQLEIWAGRVGADFIRQKSGADPSAVAFDGIGAAQSRGTDVVIVDTAGRLHTKANLMEELKKVKRVIAKKMEGAPHEVLLVLDANTGQNAIQQARQFDEVLGLTGIILTKLDGTAKGGVIVGISDELELPVRFIGIGERLDDLRQFKPDEFVDALFGA